MRILKKFRYFNVYTFCVTVQLRVHGGKEECMLVRRSEDIKIQLAHIGGDFREDRNLNRGTEGKN